MTHDPHTDALITDAIVGIFGVETSILLALILKKLTALLSARAKETR